MKIQLDTVAKTIKVEERVNLMEFIDIIKKLLPDGVWKTFSLETDTTIVWTNPITIIPSYPYYPYCPWWTTTTGTVQYDNYTYTVPNGVEGINVTYTLQEGIYNVEV